MPSRVTIFDHFGNPIAEANTATTRSWILNGVGRCQFRLPTFTDVNSNPFTIQYGNLVLVEHLPTVDESGSRRGTLPPWVGVILPPREWEYGLVTITAYSAENLLAYRPMPYATVPGSGGSIFSQIIDFGLRFGGFPVQQGAIYFDGPSTSVQLRLSAYEEIVNLTKVFTQDFDVTPQRGPNNQLALFANWYSQKGVNVPAVFSEGIRGNMRLPKLTEQGTLSNVTIGYNTSSSTGSRITSVQRDFDSIGDYGIFGTSQNFTAGGQAGVDAATLSYTKNNARPIYTLDLTALDVGKTFSDLVVGNVWSVVLKSIGFFANRLGFEGTARITGIEYDDQLNEAKLTTQVIASGLTKQNYA